MDHSIQNNLEERDEQELDERLARLADSLLKKRDEAVEGRAASGIERQWREDRRAFEGLDGTQGRSGMIDYATGEAWVGKKGSQKRRSKVVVNITRGKCETAEGRFAEIVLPTDDKNWGLLPTPIAESASPVAPPAAPPPAAGPPPGSQAAAPSPQMPPMLGSAGAMPPPESPEPQGMIGPPPAVPSPEAKKADAEKRCAAMVDEIDDQLEECGYNTECRKVQRSAAKLGTGVLKGPNVVKRIRQAWVEQTDGTDSVHVLKSVENMKPASVNVDIWNVYPDPNCGINPKRGAYIWERDHILPREVKSLIGTKGYIRKNLMEVLKEEPVRTVVQIDKGGAQKVDKTVIGKGSPYERWEYYGDVDVEDLIAMGCKCPEDAGIALSACVVFINDRPVKVQLNTLDTGELPYDFFQWVESDDSPWGIGEPRKLMWQQRVITAVWRAMMDNAADSAGAMVIMGKDVEPEDGIWDITGKKIWQDLSEDGDVRKAFAQFQITNNQSELQNIIELALKFTDLESGVPALAQGEKGSAPETLGGMQILMQGADTTRRRQVKQWDDQITRPHIARYYHWNMQYNPKPEIKGDFEVDARGTSVLLVKDQAIESLKAVMQLRADPEVNILVDWPKAVKQLFDAMHLNILKSEEEIKAARDQAAQAPPPAMPQVEVAKIRAAADEKITTLELQAKSAEAEKDRQNKIAIQMIDEKMQTMELTSVERLALDKLKTELAGVTMKLNVQTQLSKLDIAHQKDIAVGNHMVDVHKFKNPPKPSITPPTEPQGRAARGKSFHQ